ncbi:hypothetical protein F0562_029302 [Nyssa sinensis]|uniref:3-ketoacyl-CoA synthase n=1 Tax=Nyssa sinensis TaxID=561372 RepID=A0A5J5B2K7_9ASTE|nr:hypothetical protein F0562_029302 [Nyssa sinensis]
MENLMFLSAMVLILTVVYLSRKSKHVYLLDFICFRPPDSLRFPISSLIELMEVSNVFSRDTIDFQSKVIERSGLGNDTYLPPGIHSVPPNHSLNFSIMELEMVLSSVVHNLITKLNINPKAIDFLITNCGLTCPTPSLSATIINKFGLRSNVKSFNLSGMGCGAGILAIGLAQDLLKVHNNSLALVLSMEAVCSNIYNGSVKSMLIPNCLFRMGGTAILLSNTKCDKERAKYELQHVVRTHLGSKTASYKCIFQDSDDEGYLGVSLSRTILQVAGEALKTNMASLGLLVLPYSEQIKYGLSVGWKKFWAPARKRDPYIPDFKKAFDHFCIHAGGKAVIDTIKEKLNLTERDVEPSKMTLYRFGNTSSSSTWYSLCYLEAKGRVKKGDRVWQLAFGSGFKCNSAVWKCISKLKPDDSNAWSDTINQYPVQRIGTK